MRMVLSWTGRPCGADAGTRHVTQGGHMSDDSEEVYGPDRAQRLLAMLRALAERIQALDRSGQLLERVPELQKLLGNTRSELFHYEVRLTYDTPEVAESRRVVDEAERQGGGVGANEGFLPVARGRGGGRWGRAVVRLAACAGAGAERARSGRGDGRVPGVHDRSEEHTSELQSPYVISYAVFCLKK